MIARVIAMGIIAELTACLRWQPGIDPMTSEPYTHQSMETNRPNIFLTTSRGRAASARPPLREET